MADPSLIRRLPRTSRRPRIAGHGCTAGHSNACRFITLCLLLLTATALADDTDCFMIHVVDVETGRGVPLVELKAVNNVRYYSDSAGYVAFCEPGLMDQAVYFHIRSHGYEDAADGFGYRGRRLQVRPGGAATIKLKRINIARRLYRQTGAGIYRDSHLAGRPVPIDEPLLNAQVFGSDSVVNTVFQGKLYWFWGDTNRPSYPLGNFHVPGAVSLLPDRGGLDPSVGVDFKYFVDERGFAKPTCQMPGQGPTWIGGLLTLDDNGRQRMYASYVKVEPPLAIYQRGLAEFNTATNEFEKVCVFDMQTPLYPHGHPLLRTEAGVEYACFGNPFPLVRVRATPGDLRDLSRYEAYTCLAPGSRADRLRVERVEGAAKFAWKRDTIPFTPKLQARLLNEGLLQPDEALFQLFNDEGERILIHSGSVNWNDYRRRWIMIGLESMGSSALGEIWYAESETPFGPWTDARKIVTHDKYSFYNPKQHPMFDQQGGRLIYFEGTYTNMFSGNPDQTPRYDYNQIMYQLDLADPRLRSPR